MNPKHKGGTVLDLDNWRQLEISSQFALLQECLVVSRLQSSVRTYMQPLQSGYVRDCSDAHLFIHELIAGAREQKRPAWCVTADVWKAFPRTWRDLYLDRLVHGVGISCGCSALVASVLERDDILVTSGGMSVVSAYEGIPEGGKLGPFGFCLVPDDLARVLQEKGFGMGLTINIPFVWKEHSWQGTGTPIPELVEKLLTALNNSGQLPRPEVLTMHPNLEASALRALDLRAGKRVPIVLHADDPFFVASSWGAMQQMLDFVGQWAHANKVAFHVGNNKTVVLNFTDDSPAALQARCPLFYPIIGLDRKLLTVSNEHKWLGLLWNMRLDFRSALKRKIGHGSCLVASLAGMVSAHTIPLAMGVQLFESKVEGAMRFGRWLFILSEGGSRC